MMQSGTISLQEAEQLNEFPQCAEIPRWLVEQTAADIAEIGSALRRIEGSLQDSDADMRGLAGDVRTIRRVLRCLDQDMRYVMEFRGGAVQRRSYRLPLLVPTTTSRKSDGKVRRET